MEIDREKLLNDLYKTRNHLVHCPSRDDIIYSFESFVALNNAYSSMMGEYFDTDKIFLDDKGTKKMLDDVYFKSVLLFHSYTQMNKKTIQSIFNNYDKFMNDINYEPCPFYNKMTRYDEKTFKDIILSYYATYGNKIYNIVKKYFDENRIEMSYEKVAEENLAAAFAHITNAMTGYIVSIHNNYNSWSMTDLVHELGHAIDAETYLFPQQKKVSVFSDILCEVPSTTYEMGFLNYLINNNIDSSARIIKDYKHSLLADASDELNYIYSLDDITTDYAGNLYDADGNVYPFREMLLYGLGYYFAFILNYLKDNDVKDFNKIFYNVISSRNDVIHLDDFADKMGISKEDFLECNLIKNDIIENQGMLKLMFPYWRSK